MIVSDACMTIPLRSNLSIFPANGIYNIIFIREELLLLTSTIKMSTDIYQFHQVSRKSKTWTGNSNFQCE